jgi:hypothetical protein
MEAKRSQFVLKMLPSFGDFAFLMPIAYLFGTLGGSRTLFNDADTAFHIRTGEWILANHRVPNFDLFSYSKAGQPWYAWEWFADAIFGWLNHLDGLRAVMLFSTAIICAAFAILYFLVRRKSNALIGIAATMVAAAASSVHWLARPHLFTLLFVVLFYAGLERVREGRGSIGGISLLAVLFPAGTVLWTGLHGGFFVGIMMICAYGGAEILRCFFVSDVAEQREAGRSARKYFLCAMGCLAASLLNPYTYHLHTHIFKTLSDPWPYEHIMEYLSPTFHDARSRFCELYLAAASAAALWHLAHRRFVEPVLIAMWAHVSLIAARNIPIFAIIAAPIIAAAAKEALGGATEWNIAPWVRRIAGVLKRAAAKADEMDRVPRWRLASVAGAALLVALTFAPNAPDKYRAEFDPRRYPAAALAAIGKDASTRIFTHDEWGDYLIWRGYPVFVDGRSDFYGNDFEDRYMDVAKVRLGWEKTLATHGVNTILMPLSEPLTGALKESTKWHVVYDDGHALVFRLNEPAARETVSAAKSGGIGRDREVTKTATGDRPITHKIKPTI